MLPCWSFRFVWSAFATLAGADCWWSVNAKSSPLSVYLLPLDAVIFFTAVGVSVAGCARYVFVNSGMAVPPSYFTSANSWPSPLSVTVTLTWCFAVSYVTPPLSPGVSPMV